MLSRQSKEEWLSWGKALFVCLLMVAFILGVITLAGAEQSVEEEPPPTVKGKCPVTKVVGEWYSSCSNCHAMRLGDNGPYYGLKKEFYRTDEKFDYPNSDTVVRDKKVYFEINAISQGLSDDIQDVLNWADKEGYDHVVFELFSPGGGLMSGWRVISLMQEWIHEDPENRILETRARGYAASAGFSIFISGKIGHRYIAPTAEMMWHELGVYSLQFGIVKETPSKLEDRAEVYRHLQNTANEWIASRGGLSKEELDEAIDKEEEWLNGQQMIAKDLADGLLWPCGGY